MKRVRPMLLALLIFTLTLPLMAAEQPQEIMKKVMEVQSSNSSALELLLTLTDAGGQARERQLQTLSLTEEGRTSSITVFLSPASVKNTRFLSVENSTGKSEQWIYLPALKRVKRIAANEEGGSFMGSDFSYSDMASTTYDATEATHTLLEETATTYTIRSVPFDKSSYGKTETTVDKSTYLPLQVDFYAKDGLTLEKQLVTQKMEQMQGRWVPKVLTMTTVASGHTTRLEILQAQYDIAMNSNYFTTKFLETGRP
ncbi:outer membrane lipoprotein-sorting protein [Sphaerochaeta sp. PS]|uniref:outer membrane lipoprotein-sorting protein n=1 Tax=Sphaerochaeta sp. PS TaxID=3076336 RepID=UPI0028A4B3BC|nr:outer membrane lipoprotein-sorting protein [Sphaerochaeta sp. PS]MDT4761015.1 outer membrane lipoprotein-sorting protein [Sphaerochaeta sp. PS]